MDINHTERKLRERIADLEFEISELKAVKAATFKGDYLIGKIISKLKLPPAAAILISVLIKREIASFEFIISSTNSKSDKTTLRVLVSRINKLWLSVYNAKLVQPVWGIGYTLAPGQKQILMHAIWVDHDHNAG